MVMLVPITKDNWKAIAALTVAHEQVAFVPANLYSIAEAQFYPDAHAYAIANEAGEWVGFTLYGRDEATGKWKLFRLMIDATQQGRGYGKAALRIVIERVRAQGATEMLVGYQATNVAARQLYAQIGFVEVQTVGGLVTASLDLTR
jgi:diamine N-acetyltransferase